MTRWKLSRSASRPEAAASRLWASFLMVYLAKSGFSPWHNQDTREYGNNLMAFLVRNADRLGILYVIWNKMIWQPATGWKSYHGPSDHTDHVHVSML